MPLGLTFAPGSQPDDPRRPQPPGASPIQEAIRVLSLRMPRVQGAGAIAPPQLLSSPGAGALPGSPSNPIIEQLLRAILGLGGPAQPPPTPDAGPFPGLFGGGGPSPFGGMPAPSLPTPMAPPAPTPTLPPRVVPADQQAQALSPRRTGALEY